MFKASTFAGAILAAISYVALSPDHIQPHTLARLQAQADAEAMADVLEASKDAAVTVCLIEGGCQ